MGDEKCIQVFVGKTQRKRQFGMSSLGWEEKYPKKHGVTIWTGFI